MKIGSSDYIFCRDEPYELHFEWYLKENDVKCGLTVYADPDDTEWFVVSNNGKRRMRRRVIKEDASDDAREGPKPSAPMIVPSRIRVYLQ